MCQTPFLYQARNRSSPERCVKGGFFWVRKNQAYGAKQSTICRKVAARGGGWKGVRRGRCQAPILLRIHGGLERPEGQVYMVSSLAYTTSSEKSRKKRLNYCHSTIKWAVAFCFFRPPCHHFVPFWLLNHGRSIWNHPRRGAKWNWWVPNPHSTLAIRR